MERLLADAEKLSGVKYDISNLSDVYEAIHVIQTELGITGTTAKEASTTIQGSLNATKAAWKNLMVAVSDESQDFGTAINEFVDSAGTFLENLIPRIKDSISGIGKLLTKLAPVVIDSIVDLAPDLIEAGGDLVVALIDGIVKNIPKLIKAAEKIGKTLIENIGKAIPKIVSGLKQLWNSLGTVTKAILAAVVAIKAFKVAVTIVQAVRTAFVALTSPVGLATAAIGALAAGVVALASAFSSSKKSAHEFTEEEKEIIEAGQEAMKSVEAAGKSHMENVSAIDEETKKTQDLWAELQTLTDENGNVEEANQERARYILGELNEALGTEYDMNDGLIGQYRTMQEEIDSLIKKQRAKRLVESYETHVADISSEKDTLLDDLQVLDAARKDTIEQAKIDQANAIAAIREVQRLYEGKGLSYGIDKTTGELSILDYGDLTYEEHGTTYLKVNEAVKAYNDAIASAQSAIDAYNQVDMKLDEIFAKETRLKQAQSLMTALEYETDAEIAQEYYDKIQSLLDASMEYRWTVAKEKQSASEAEIAALRKDYDDAVWYAQWYREKVEAGMEGFDAVGVAEAEARVAEMKEILDGLVAVAYNSGLETGNGLARGIDESEAAIISAAERAASAAARTMRSTLQIASPSKVTRRFGRFIDEGLALGMEDEANSVRRAADMVARYAIPPVGSVSAGGYGNVSAGNSTSIGSIILNVDAQGVSSVERLADLVADRINRDVLRRVAAT